MNFPNRVPVLANPQEGSSMANPSRALKAKSCWRAVSGMERLRGQMYPPVGLLNIILLALLACLPAALAGAADRRDDVVLGVDSKMHMPAYSSLAAWQARRGDLRSQITLATSLYPPRTPTPLNPRYSAKLDEDGYTIEAVALETMPGFWLGGNLYRPKDGQAKHPAIAHPHGHWKHGRLEN